MKLSYALLIALLFAGSLSALAQDIIYKTSGEEIKAKVIEINPTRVLFKQPDLFADSLFSLARQDVFMVKYANGAKELLQDQVEEISPAAVERSPAELVQLGRLDARRSYTGNKAITGAALTGFLFFPAVVVIAAVPPKITLNDVPDHQLLSNPYYYKGFRSQAHKKKLGKVAIGGAVGLLGLIMLTSISPGK
jgi:hypothetical protein